MSFDWTEYLTLAQSLAGLAVPPVSQEARARSAISRAYYAAHHVAATVAQAKDGYTAPPVGQNVHLALINHFQRHADPVRRRIGTHLDTLRIMRGRADYDHVIPQALINNALAQVRLAANLITTLRAL